MEIYPRFKFRPRLLGEASVYDLLARIGDEHGFAIHSVNLPEHAYKRWGEADFVIVSRAGLLLLEVKGGNVEIAGRIWRYENARGQAIESSEGPQRQALSAAVALEQLLTRRLGRKIRCRWGVVFPLCTFNRQLDELPASRLADQRQCMNYMSFETWLSNVPFDQHCAEDFALSDSDIDEIRGILLPEMSAASSLGLSVAGVDKGVIKLTNQQFGILDSLAANPRLTVTGGAGTGKTELAVLCARAELASGHRPAIVASGMALVRNLESRLAGSGIPVCSDRIPDGCDVLVVDEGQDFAQLHLQDALFAQLPGGLEHGRWRWFMDPNLQYLATPPDPAALLALNAHSASVNLTRNVRSTQEIVRSIQAFLAADIGLSVIDGYGVKVGFHDARNVDEETDSIVDLIPGLLADGIQPRDIALLSPNGSRGPVGLRISNRLGHVLREMTLDGGFASSVHGVISDIASFRGLEARVVILTDLDVIVGSPDFERNLYIGMTRASVALHVFSSPAVTRAMVALLENNSQEP
jgi:Nuclease-related domain